MDDPVSKIKDLLSIDVLVSSYVKLEKSGSSLKGKCPFHNDKTPSFYVSPDRGFYKCFGCGESGDIFSFIQKIEGMDFKEALQKLGQRTGVDIKSNFKREKNTEGKEKMYKILDECTLFWQKNLNANDTAKDYLKNRGFTKELFLKYRIGYASNSFDEIKSYLIQKGYTEKDIEGVGIIKTNENGKSYDRFRERIIFPIFDLSGRIIAYSGRYIGSDDKNAKYLNSPETPLFYKSKVLYGFNFAKEAIRRNNFVIVAEGQIDMIMSQSFGYPNSVVTSGTSLTEDHLREIKRFTNNIILAFDGDEAGFNAAHKACIIALENQFNVKIVDIKENEDPADIILKDPKSWKKKVSSSLDFVDFFIEKIFYKRNSGKISETVSISMIEELVLSLLINIKNSITKDLYISKIAERIGVSKESVSERLIQLEKNNTKSNAYFQKQIEKTIKKGIITDNKLNIVKNLTGIYFWQKNLPKKKRFLEHPQEVLNILKNRIDDNLFEKIQNLNDEDKIDSLIFEVESIFETKKQLEDSILESKAQLNKIKLEEEIKDLQIKLKEAENNTLNEKEADRLKKEIFNKIKEK